MTHYGMLIKVDRCVGCYGCTAACKAENKTSKGVFWAAAIEGETGKYPNARRYYIPTLCMHCENAPCVDVCPTGASHKRPDGIVLVDYEKCIGCKYCVQACPYGARHFIDAIRGYYPAGLTDWETWAYSGHKEGVVEKCTFCVQRVEAGVKAGLTPGVDREATPACVNTCLGRARVFGDLDDPYSQISQEIIKLRAMPLMPALGTKPSVYYAGYKGEL
jgi:phenylacetyl-CoA:acceptor oxidoreductase subunit 1